MALGTPLHLDYFLPCGGALECGDATNPTPSRCTSSMYLFIYFIFRFWKALIATSSLWVHVGGTIEHQLPITP